MLVLPQTSRVSSASQFTLFCPMYKIKTGLLLYRAVRKLSERSDTSCYLFQFVFCCYHKALMKTNAKIIVIKPLHQPNPIHPSLGSNLKSLPDPPCHSLHQTLYLSWVPHPVLQHSLATPTCTTTNLQDSVRACPTYPPTHRPLLWHTQTLHPAIYTPILQS